MEAILIVGGDSVEAFLVPIDACYSLAGALRREWRGFDGGAEVRQIMADLLAGLSPACSPAQPRDDRPGGLDGAHRRRYSADEAQRLNDLFRDTSRWAETVKPIQLATVSTMVPGFTSQAEVELQVPCTYDLEVASARYLQGLDDGTIPLLLLFSCTVFLANGESFSVELIPGSRRSPTRCRYASGRTWWMRCSTVRPARAHRRRAARVRAGHCDCA